MAFKVMGITAGRKDSNCEILLKEALLACQEMGAEVRMINLKDFDLLDCNGCTACTMGMSMGKHVPCSLETEDGKWRFVIAPNGLERDRTTEEGRGVHCDEIADTQGGFFSNPEKHKLVAERLPKYKEIQFPGLD